MSKPFQFKQFSLRDDQCAMKIGTDGVLLGAWVNVDHAKTVLDIGAGSGLIALMIAQRSKVAEQIMAVELGKEDAQQATENALASPWPSRIQVHQSRIQDFRSDHSFHLIVSNPPFFNNSLLPPSGKRKAARHTESLSYQDLLASAERLITTGGIFAVVLPAREGALFISMAQFHGFYPSRQCAVYTRASKPQERWLLEFSRQPSPAHIEKLILFTEGNERSPEYEKLTELFYL
ncbi:MAG: hypothetical protein C0523_04370 [Cytophaga sp.]|nr:hypothetical protein [Cytophaga sp.]